MTTVVISDAVTGNIVSAGRRNQHARRARYPERRTSNGEGQAAARGQFALFDKAAHLKRWYQRHGVGSKGQGADGERRRVIVFSCRKIENQEIKNRRTGTEQRENRDQQSGIRIGEMVRDPWARAPAFA
jgi:hypothetical protein